jgi:uncharacterized protein (TIGR00730 family)
MSNIKTISVFCGSKETQNQRNQSFVQPLQQLFQLLSTSQNVKIAYGGGKTGLMKEIWQGCLTNKIPMISVNCERWKTPEEEIECIECYYYSSILERQDHLIKIADAYIVLPGGVGTLFEMLQAITCNDVKEANKPIFVLNFNNYFMQLFDFLEWGRNCGMITKSNSELNIHIFDNSIDLVDKINSFL